MPKRTTPRTPPKIDLSPYAEEHLLYEAQMFVMARSLKCARPSFEMNLQTEACALHLRNLYEFFYPADPYDDDVIAQDYAPDWSKKQPPRTPLLKTARKRANKELAHLTTERKTGTPKEKDWDWNLLSTDLRAVVSAFIALNPNMTAKTIAQLQEI
jgi:hypothetical protein